MRYRKEIDGLRAVAVIPVILFHAGVKIFSGGYIGVDVFFVISGYLITSLILEDLQNDQFSVVAFYERRARRILPAIFCVMLCCIPFAWHWMLPSQLEDFGNSLIAVTVFASNILFWKESGYFAADANLNPLLHTWSLAVEEQYYLLFPVCLTLLWRFGRNTAAMVLIAVTIISLLLSEWGVRQYPIASFYLAPTRVWELLAGSLCAFMIADHGPRKNNLLSALGLVAIAASVFLFDEGTSFPGLYAGVPVLGTALIIVFGGNGTLVARLLSLPGFVGIGLISYSAYLWHQPLFAFARMRSLGDPDQTLLLGLGAASLGLAYVTWRFIETPFRRRGQLPLPSRSAVFWASLCAALAFVGFGGLLRQQNGFPDRKFAGGLTSAQLDARMAFNYGLHRDCFGTFTLSGHCAVGDDPEILLWGDSFAMQLAPAILASDPDVSMRQHTFASCMPLLGLSIDPKRADADWAGNCITFNDQVLAWLGQNPTVEHVVLSSTLTVGQIDFVDRNGRVIKASQQFEEIGNALRKTVEAIERLGRTVVIVSPPPSSKQDVGRCIAATQRFVGHSDRCDFTRSDFPENLVLTYQLLDALPVTIAVIRLDQEMCKTGVCKASHGDVLMYRDARHLSQEGAVYIGDKIIFVEK